MATIFQSMVRKKMKSKPKSVDKKATGKMTTANFAADNEEQLSFVGTIENRSKKAKKVINIFLNPMWTENYGSGGNMEGHL